MFIAKNFVVAVIGLVDICLWLYVWVILLRAVISWVNPDPYNKLVVFLYRATEPVLATVRRALPWRGAGIDFSPLVVLALIYLTQNFLLKSLLDYVQRLGG